MPSLSIHTYKPTPPISPSFCLPSMVDAEPGYSAALALYLTLRTYDIPAPPGKTWLKVLEVADDEKFARA